MRYLKILHVGSVAQDTRHTFPQVTMRAFRRILRRDGRRTRYFFSKMPRKSARASLNSASVASGPTKWRLSILTSPAFDRGDHTGCVVLGRNPVLRTKLRYGRWRTLVQQGKDDPLLEQMPMYLKAIPPAVPLEIGQGAVQDGSRPGIVERGARIVGHPSPANPFATGSSDLATPTLFLRRSIPTCLSSAFRSSERKRPLVLSAFDMNARPRRISVRNPWTIVTRIVSVEAPTPQVAAEWIPVLLVEFRLDPPLVGPDLEGRSTVS